MFSNMLKQKKEINVKTTVVSIDDLILSSDLPVEINDQNIIDNAKNKAVEIFTRIESVSVRIAEAKKGAEVARDMKTGFFGGTGKKATATSNALVRTNEAIAEMNDLIQEAILFTKSSIEYSTIMMQAMSKMVEHGFKNANGEILELNESGTEFAEIIMSQADEYTNRHLQLIKLQKDQKLALDNAQLINNENDERLADEIKRLKDLSEQSDQEIERLIHHKTAEILKRSDEQDLEQLEKITSLDKTAKKIKELSDANDLRHDAEIQQLFQLVKQNQSQINSLSNYRANISIGISIISLLTSMILLVIIFTGQTT